MRCNPPLELVDADFNLSPLGWAIYGSEHGWYCRTGDYASTVEAGTPFVGCVEALQANCKSRFGRLVWKALANFAAAGRFQRFGTAGSYASLLRLIEVSIEPPRVANQNKLQETQRREILHRAGVLSLRTWQTQEGLDPEMEM